MDVVVLGSGTPVAGPGRAGAATALVAGDERWVLVDCGRGATQRALDAGLDLTGLVAVAITHHHSDHVNDLATLATTRWSAGATPLTVVAPEGPSARFTRRCLDAYDDQAFHSQARPEAGARPATDVQVFTPRADPTEVLVTGGWRLTSALVDHHPVAPAVGYRVEHDDGGRVAVSGDTAVCAGMEALAEGVDVLVHEALRSDRVTPEALAWNAGARAVGELAARIRPGTLVLTHLIPAPVTGADHEAYLAECGTGASPAPRWSPTTACGWEFPGEGGRSTVRIPQEGVMKVRSSLKSLKKKEGSVVVRRRGRTYVVNKRNPRWKARQG